MEELKKQGLYIGNGPSETQRPEPEEDLTEASSTSSPQSIAIESANTLNAQERPKSAIEGLGLLQTRFSDLSDLKLKIILSQTPKGNLAIVISWPGHSLGVKDGQLLADGIPVLKEEE
jgi:hypothetical protein